MTQLDKHGARILAFVERYQRQHHRSPTYREIGAAVGLPSNDHVARDLRRLVQQGYLSFTPGVSRSIVLLKTASKSKLARNHTLPAFDPPTVRPPASDDLSHLAAGLFEDEKDTFLLRARGDAMRDALLEEGDLVVVKRCDAWSDGDLLAVYLKHARRTTLKYFYRENGRLRLQSPLPDAAHEIVKPADVEIRGSVLAIIRKRDLEA